MATHEEYGQTIVATTARLKALIVTAIAALRSAADGLPGGTVAGPVEVTTRIPQSARDGVVGTSVNLFLFRDSVLTLSDISGATETLSTQLHYLVTAYPPREADPELIVQLLHGAICAAVEANPRHGLVLRGGERWEATAAVADPPLPELAGLWSASGTPFRLSAVIVVRLVPEAHAASPLPPPSVSEVVEQARPGLVVVFAGADAAAKAAAAVEIARQLGQSVLRIKPDRLVSKYAAETEQNLKRVLASGGRSGARVLLFDEAEALFGKRTDVGDAHNRYEGVEVNDVIDQLAAAPSVIIVSVRDPDDVLLKRAGLVLRF